MYDISQIRPILQILSQTAAVLVGGQAINLWSEYFGDVRLSPWKELKPFTSRDIDILGSHALVKLLAEQTGGQIALPDTPAHTPNIAQVFCRHPAVDIDVLKGIKGLNTAEVIQMAVPLTHAGLRLSVLHPVHCIESKAINLLTLDQQVEGRQDEKHLRLALANCREFLRSLAPDHALEVIVPWAERLRIGSLTDEGLQVQRIHQLRFYAAIPLQEWQQAQGPLREWADKISPAWEKQVDEQIRELAELQSWFRNLNPPRTPEGT